MVSSVRINRRRLGAGVLLAAFALSQAGASSAQADGPGAIAWNDPIAVTVEYGQQWGFEATGAMTFSLAGPWTGTVTFHGGPSGYHPGVYSYQYDHATTIVSAYNDFTAAALGPGTYTVDATVTNGVDSYTTTTPASLVISPAALGLDIRVLADPNNPAGAIVTAQFTGRFVDEYQSSFYDGVALSPAGEWHITIEDEDGEVAIERNLERSAGDDVLATSFYWTGAKPDKQYTATAEFTPTGSSNANFEIGSATAFAYTAPVDPRPTPSSTATAKPAADIPESSGLGLPLWALVLIIVLLVGLGVVVTILSVRLSKRPGPPVTGAVST